jgi:diguanylate cyclase (GGDEF)-like protein
MTMNAKILLVQNAQARVSGTKRHLEGAGYDVVWAGSGVSALGAVMQEPADLVLIDTSLPDIDGSDLCRRFRLREDMQYVPIILLAGQGYTPVCSDGNNGGPDDVLKKPYSDGELDARIAVALRKRAKGKTQEAAEVTTLSHQPVTTGGQTAQPAPEGTIASSQEREPEPLPAAAPEIAGQQPGQAPDAKLTDAIREDEVTDPDTGLFSRKQFDAMFSKEFKRVARFNEYLSCMLIDLEGGKLRRQADKATVKEVVQLVQQTIREVDTAASWSGEALVILLPNTLKNDAVQAAARILEAVANHPFTWPESVKFTMSIGVAGLPDRKIGTEQELIEAVTAACRRAAEFMIP